MDNDGKMEQELRTSIYTLNRDLDDFLDEYADDDIAGCVEDIDRVIGSLEEFRSIIRERHRELENMMGSDDYQLMYGGVLDDTIGKIKGRLIDVKTVRREMRQAGNTEQAQANAANLRYFNFVYDEISLQISDLEGAVAKPPADLSDEELLAKSKDVTEFQRKLDAIWAKISEMMKLNVDGNAVDQIQERYRELVNLKKDFVVDLQEEVSKREIKKKENFKKSKLNINLQKFAGYSSAVDIYTFKTDFEKLNKELVPTENLPDLLKNNYLTDPALSLVKGIKDINEIWARLKKAYGSPKHLMQKKFRELSSVDPGKRGDSSKTELWISKIIFSMKDLSQLAAEHGIEGMLYNGDGIDRVLKLLGEARVTRWLSKDCYHDDDDSDGEDDADFERKNKDSWVSLISFLEKELRVIQRKALVFQNFPDNSPKGKPEDQRSRGGHYTDVPDEVPADAPAGAEGHVTDEAPIICSICGKDDHVTTTGPGYSKVVQYYSCAEFTQLSPGDRFRLLRRKSLCFQCLLPGADWNTGKHKEGKCQRQYTCNHESHNRFKRKKHVLVCDDHKGTPENAELLRKYKERCFPRDQEIPPFSREIGISFHVQTDVDVPNNKPGVHFEDEVVDQPQNLDQIDSEEVLEVESVDVDDEDDSDVEDIEDIEEEIVHRAIYQFQIIEANKNRFLVFYDNGCSNFVVRYKAVQKLGKLAVLNHPPPLLLKGLGGIVTESKYGEYKVTLRKADGKRVRLTGPCLEKITDAFPQYPLQGAVQDDIHSAYEASGGRAEDLPSLPKFVGGEVDLMFGSRILRYHPDVLFQLPSGLTIYRSKFFNADGGTGVVGGPHEVFDMIAQQVHFQQGITTFLSEQLKLFSYGYAVNPDLGLLGYKDTVVPRAYDVYICGYSDSAAKRSEKAFESVEGVGSTITYRCPQHRFCKDCREGDQREELSLKEEMEDSLLNNCVKLDVVKRKCSFKMPVIMDPAVHLAPNGDIALKMYYRVLNKLKEPKNKLEVIAAEAKLQRLGKVEYVRNLPDDVQEMLKLSPVQNFIPWNIVYKETSITTACRPVFNASFPTKSGKALNDIVAKGRNRLNKLQEVFIRWGVHPVGFHTDVQTMYPSVELEKEDWCLQRYWWNETLDPKEKAEEKVITSCIYGIKPSGNIAEKALRLTADHSKKEFPEVYDIIRHDTYMDDTMSGSTSVEEVHKLADEMEIVLGRGGFTLKGITISGSPPVEKLANEDGRTIFVGGMRFDPEKDELSYHIKDLNFGKNCRGRKPKDKVNIIPDKLTRRHCTSKVHEIFDLTGKLAPIIAAMKLDLHQLVMMKLSWDDCIPDNLRALWKNHFEMMSEIKNIKYKRAYVPEDAVSLDINTLDFGDASSVIACVAIYARFLRRNGEYSCQLILARTKLVPDNMTQPRAELLAGIMCAHSGEVARKALEKFHTGHIKFGDNQIALHWIRNDERPLKKWVRNRVLEIRRLTDLQDWRYINSKNMIADIGTRRGCTLDDIKPGSSWISGYSWMKDDESNFPSIKLDQMNLNNEELKAAKAEMSLAESTFVQYEDQDGLIRHVSDKTREMYEFSKYLIDPNRYKLSKVVKLLALVYKVIRFFRSEGFSFSRVKAKLLESTADWKLINVQDEDIKSAKIYYFRKATAEVKQFHKKKLKQFKEKDGILYFTGRLLPKEVSVVTPLADTMKDLKTTTFCVPAIEKDSPLAYAIINDIHWNHEVVKHRGVETVWRYVLMEAYVFEGRDLVKTIKKCCERCRYLYLKAIEVAMGPMPEYNFTIAPAFYVTQMDLAGPFKAYCQHNRRSTIKIWLLVCCCTTTSAIKIKVMEDYSSQAFVYAFIRFSSDAGYPRTLLIDEGSQLIKGCQTMKLDFHDIKQQVQRDVKAEFEMCPVGGHNVNGKVERKIREVKESLERNMNNERMSIIQWETMSSKIANSINDLPLALRGQVSDLEALDLITPNRLLLGRNNNRCPDGDMIITDDPDKILVEHSKIFQAWFENWLVSCVPNMIEQPKWYKTMYHIKVGDIVLFTKNDCLTPTYQYGMVSEVRPGSDGVVRKVVVKYRNATENVDRTTNRSVRTLVVIHRVDETNIPQELYEMSRSADVLYSNSLHCNDVRK